MSTKSLFLIFLLVLILTTTTTTYSSSSFYDFTFNGFNGSNLALDGFAKIHSDGLLELTNFTTRAVGHAFLPAPIHFRSNSSGKLNSFSTTFAFAFLPEANYISGHGLAFFISRTTDFSAALRNQYLGLFNEDNNGDPGNHIFAVEFDTLMNSEFHDIDDNHCGIDLNGLHSVNASSVGYYDDGTGSFVNLTLRSGQPMQVWVDFDGEGMRLDVTMAPMPMARPRRPMLSSVLNMSGLVLDPMYVGFSSTTGSFHTYHYFLGWSFKMNGVAKALDYAKLPLVPRFRTKRKSPVVAISVPIASCLFVLIVVAAIVMIKRRRMKYAELLEDWEKAYGPHRFSYKDLFHATKGFKDKELLGVGGFGRVYKGVLPNSGMEIAVKKVSHDSKNGMKQFVAEIVSIGQLRHRNVVQLLGYCRRKGELLLVYDFMPNSSLDRFLYGPTDVTLNWEQRFRIIKGVASGLLYLHEDYEQVVIHRDVKASNVLLDSEMNGRLGDFGLAKLYEHGTDPKTTHVVGTLGYIAPELSAYGKATTATDTFAFGVFLLEVACGRRPIKPNAEGHEVILMDWVLASWQRGFVLETMDARLMDEYCTNEAELVLKLGLLCSNPVPAERPSMQQVLQFLEGDATFTELPPSYLNFDTMSPFQNDGMDGYFMRSFYSGPSMSSISGGR